MVESLFDLETRLSVFETACGHDARNDTDASDDDSEYDSESSLEFNLERRGPDVAGVKRVIGGDLPDLAISWPRDQQRLETLFAHNAFEHDTVINLRHKKTLAFCAVLKDRPDLLRFLRAHAVNLALPSTYKKSTALMCACTNGRVECTKLLVDLYTMDQIRHRNRRGETALSKAALNLMSERYPECVAIIQDRIDNEHLRQLSPERFHAMLNGEWPVANTFAKRVSKWWHRKSSNTGERAASAPWRIDFDVASVIKAFV